MGVRSCYFQKHPFHMIMYLKMCALFSWLCGLLIGFFLARYARITVHLNIKTKINMQAHAKTHWGYLLGCRFHRWFLRNQSQYFEDWSTTYFLCIIFELSFFLKLLSWIFLTHCTSYTYITEVINNIVDRFWKA